MFIVRETGSTHLVILQKINIWFWSVRFHCSLNEDSLGKCEACLCNDVESLLSYWAAGLRRFQVWILGAAGPISALWGEALSRVVTKTGNYRKLANNGSCSIDTAIASGLGHVPLDSKESQLSLHFQLILFEWCIDAHVSCLKRLILNSCAFCS